MGIRQRIFTIRLASIMFGSFWILAAAYLYFRSCRPLVFVLIAAFISIGFGFISPNEMKNASYSAKGIKAKGTIAIFIILFFALLKLKPESCPVYFTLAVEITDKRGNIILKNEGEIFLDLFQGQVPAASINNEGIAYFQNVPIDDSGKVRIQNSAHVFLIKPDSIYHFKNEKSIHVNAYIIGLDRIFGYIKNQSNPLPGVSVSFDTITTKTDSTGHFCLSIPEQLQQRRYKVRVFKFGYSETTALITPEIGLDVPIQMDKLSNSKRSAK